jgi:hypothetical protein
VSSFRETVYRLLVAERSQHSCEIAIPGVCRGAMTSVHHRRKEGRDWAPSNLLAACGDGTTGCHGWVEAHPEAAREEGLWLFTGDGEPHEVAVHMRWMNLRGWYVLDDEGMLEWDGGELEGLWEHATREMTSPSGWGTS